MKINPRDPFFSLPILFTMVAIALVVIIYPLFGTEEVEKIKLGDNELNTSVGDVSKLVKKKDISDKLQSYEENYDKNKNDRFTAIEDLKVEDEKKETAEILYTEEEMRQMILKEQQKMKEKQDALRGIEEDPYSDKKLIESGNDEYKRMIEEIRNQNRNIENGDNERKEEDPFSAMKKQYLFLDSLNKANDPELKKVADKEALDRKMLELYKQKELATLPVTKSKDNSNFNTISREQSSPMIKAVIDENIKGYAGSRIRLRLLESIVIAKTTIPKNSYLYALITGFGDQRVQLDIVSLMYNEEIYPIQLSIYDVDGMKGLYIPSSQFREFTKELGQTSIQGMNTNELTGSNNDFMMSAISRMFTTTSNAIAKLIRQNKVNLKYSSLVYLLDEKELNKQQQQQN